MAVLLLKKRKEPFGECGLGLAPVCVRQVHFGARFFLGLALVQMVCENRSQKLGETVIQPRFEVCVPL